MKLLFDENLSYKLVNRLSDIFPESTHINFIQLNSAEDMEIWSYAKDHNFVIVTKDSDFIEISDLMGSPPFVICIRSGNVRVDEIENVIREHANEIQNIFNNHEAGIIQLQ